MNVIYIYNMARQKFESQPFCSCGDAQLGEVHQL